MLKLFTGQSLVPGMYLTKPIDVTKLLVGGGVTGSIMTSGTSWMEHSVAGACGIKLLLSNTSPTGNFATMRLRARSDVATPTWNSNTIAADLSSSANIDDYGELLCLSAYAQDNGKNQTRATHWNTSIKACMLCTGTSTGSRYALVVTDYSSTKASAGQYLARFEKPTGACVIDGVLTVGNCDQFTYLFNFEVASGFMSSSDTRVKVKTVAGDKYIHLESS